MSVPRVLHSSPVGECLGCSVLWLLWEVLLWTRVCKYLLETLLFVLLKPRSGIAGVWGSSLFNFSRSLHSVFLYQLYHFYHQGIGFRFPHILANTCYFLRVCVCVLIEAILIGVRVWFCISLMLSDVEHYFHMLVAICVSYLERCGYKFSACFFKRVIWFLKFFISFLFFWLTGRFPSQAFPCSLLGEKFLPIWHL